jgi:hypothetical protein
LACVAESLLTCAVSAIAFLYLGLVVWVGTSKAFDVIAAAFQGGLR